MSLFRLSRPSQQDILRFISLQKDSPFSYSEVGASSRTPPKGYNLDRNSIQLGRGEARWKRAVETIRGWKMFNLPWIQLYPPNAPIQVGTEVVVVVKHFGFYSMNACRIVYIVQEENLVKRFGFAYGTLVGHAESGEERFTVEWHEADNKISYDILAFSRPRALLARLGHPLSRSLQRRFAKDSMSAMFDAVTQD
jgi:uncharacterized protein (UPF0548 family)